MDADAACPQRDGQALAYQGASVKRGDPEPDDYVLIRGMLDSTTNFVEHPELIAERLMHYVDIVGADRVIASTDCGLGGRIHPDIAWAKLASLGEGARRA